MLRRSRPLACAREGGAACCVPPPPPPPPGPGICRNTMRGSCSACGLEAVTGDVATDAARAAANTTVVTTATCSKTETMPPMRAAPVRCGRRGAGSTNSMTERATIPRVEGQEECHNIAGLSGDDASHAPGTSRRPTFTPLKRFRASCETFRSHWINARSLMFEISRAWLRLRRNAGLFACAVWEKESTCPGSCRLSLVRPLPLGSCERRGAMKRVLAISSMVLR